MIIEGMALRDCRAGEVCRIELENKTPFSKGFISEDYSAIELIYQYEGKVYTRPFIPNTMSFDIETGAIESIDLVSTGEAKLQTPAKPSKPTFTLDPKWKWIAQTSELGTWRMFTERPEKRTNQWCNTDQMGVWPFVETPEERVWGDSLHEIVDGELIRIPQRPDLKQGQKVNVWNTPKEGAPRRPITRAHFHSWGPDGFVFVYASGKSPFTADAAPALEEYEFCKVVED